MLHRAFVGLKTYSAYDPVDLPVRILGVLHYFNDAPIHEAVRKIKELENIELSHDDINLLINFEVLSPL